MAVDLSHGQHDIEVRLQQWRATAVLPPCFATRAQGLVPGQQTINRAELCAIVATAKLTMHSQHQNATVYSDSTFAICEHTRAVAQLPSEHPDIGNLLQQSSPLCLIMEKVKSHQDQASLSGMELWHAAGNSFADAAARASCLHDYSFLVDVMEEIAHDVSKQTDLLSVFHRYLLQLSEEEWKLKCHRNSEAKVATQVAAQMHTPSQRFLQWSSQYQGQCQSPPLLLPDLADDWVLAANTPPWFTTRVWAWARKLCWSPVSPKNPGVTSLELLVHFVYEMSLVPPAHSSGSSTGWVKITGDSLHQPVTVQEWTQLLIKTTRQLERFLGCKLLPPARTKVRTLFPLEETVPRKGLQRAPIWPSSAAFFDLLTSTLDSSGAQALLRYVATSNISWPCTDKLDSQHVLMPATAREKLARWLRGLHA